MNIHTSSSSPEFWSSQVRPLQTSALGFAQLEIKCLLGIDYPNRRKRGEEEHRS